MKIDFDLSFPIILLIYHNTRLANPNGLQENAINTALPNAGITSNDVVGFSKVTTTLRTGEAKMK